MQSPYETYRYVGTTDLTLRVRVQYAVCADNVRAARHELMRELRRPKARATSLNRWEALTGREAAQLNLPDGGVVLLA